MRDQSISVRTLLARSEQRLAIHQIAGPSGLSNRIDDMHVHDENREGNRLPFPAHRVLLVTPPETLLRQLGTSSRTVRPGGGVSCIFLCASDHIPDRLIHFSEQNKIPVLASHFDSCVLESRLKGLLREKMHHRILMQGVLLHMFDTGVLIQGESGCGKTRSALELVRKGRHLWVADDVVEIARHGKALYAKGHPITRRLIDLKEDGVRELRAVVGCASIAEETVLRLVVEIQSDEDMQSGHGPEPEKACLNIMGTEIPRLQIRRLPGQKRHADQIERKVRAFQSGGGLS